MRATAASAWIRPVSRNRRPVHRCAAPGATCYPPSDPRSAPAQDQDFVRKLGGVDGWSWTKSFEATVTGGNGSRSGLPARLRGEQLADGRGDPFNPQPVLLPARVEPVAGDEASVVSRSQRDVVDVHDDHSTIDGGAGEDTVILPDTGRLAGGIAVVRAGRSDRVIRRRHDHELRGADATRKVIEDRLDVAPVRLRRHALDDVVDADQEGHERRPQRRQARQLDLDHVSRGEPVDGEVPGELDASRIEAKSPVKSGASAATSWFGQRSTSA